MHQSFGGWRCQLWQHLWSQQLPSTELQLERIDMATPEERQYSNRVSAHRPNVSHYASMESGYIVAQATSQHSQFTGFMERAMGAGNYTHAPKGSFSCWAKLAYRMDAILSRRKYQCLSLVGAGLVQVSIGGLVWSLFIEDRDDEDYDRYRESFWEAWTFMADPGCSSGPTRTDQRIVAASITLGGIIFFASMLGMIVDILREKMEALRQGKSNVIESDHVLILGWNDKAIHLIHELCIANESERGGVVVVLAPHDKEHMEIELSLVLPPKQRLGTTVVFRSGSSLLTSDLDKVSAYSAKSIVILAEKEGEHSDDDTLRCLLALRGMKRGMRGHVVAEVRDAENAPLVQLVGGDMVDTLVSHDLLGRLMAQAARQVGLAKVYEAVLGFEGDEFYIAEWPELVGVSFADCLTRFPDAVPIGIRLANGNIALNPPHYKLIEPGDEIVVIAEDNDTYRPCPPQELDEGECPEVEVTEPKSEKILFCGWRRHIRDILLFLDRVVAHGSEVHIMTHFVPLAKRTAKLMEEGLDTGKLRNLKLVHHMGNTSVRRKLEALPIGTFTSAMIFADQEYESDTMHADSHSLATLLLCRDIQESHMSGGTRTGAKAENGTTAPQRPSNEWNVASSARSCRYPLTNMEELSIKLKESFSVVCEILDPRTQRIITGNKQVALASDFCQTNKIVAQIASMIAEERGVKALLEELWGVSGASIDVVPSERYSRPGEVTSFWVLAKRAIMNFDEIVIGYQERHSTEKTVLNPPDKNEAMGWTGIDLAIIRTNEEHVNKDKLPHFERNASERNIRESARELFSSDSVEQEYTAIASEGYGRNAAKESGPPADTSFKSRISSWLSKWAFDIEAEAGSREETAQDPQPTVEDVDAYAIEPSPPATSSQKSAKTQEIIANFNKLRSKMSKKEWFRVELALGVLSQVLQASENISRI